MVVVVGIHRVTAAIGTARDEDLGPRERARTTDLNCIFEVKDLFIRRLEVGVPKGYWVSVYRTISDPEKLAAYNQLAGPAVQLAGGRLLSRGVRVVAHDAGIAERTVLIEFDSFEQAVMARDSEAYQEALAALSDGVERDFRIIEGLD